MFMAVQRMVAFATALSVVSALGLASVHAADARKHPPATQPAKITFAGDPYLLTTDPVTGAPLGDKPIIYKHEGRELRFADQASIESFKADPAKYLPKVDQQMIAQQLPFYPLTTCMVSGDKLSSPTEKPTDIIYKNRLVRFCCDDCVKDFTKDPDKFIAKLNAAVIAKQAAGYPLTRCMVSGEAFGGDEGPPVDIVIGSRLVRFCCSGCLDDFNKNPAKFFKIIDDAAQKKSAAREPTADGPAQK
jgi:YHS domain-containing protein